MKFEHNPKYTTIAIYALIVIVIAMVIQQALSGIGVVFGFFDKLVGFVYPAIYGIVIAFLLNPILRKIEGWLLPKIVGDRLKPTTRRGISLVLTYLVALVLLGLFILIVLPPLLSSLLNLFSNIPAYIKSLTQLYSESQTWIESFIVTSMGEESTEIAAEISTRIFMMISDLMNSLYGLLENFLAGLISFTTSLTAGIMNLLLGIIISIYLLLDREKLFAQLQKIGRALFSKEFYQLLHEIAMDINRIFSGFVIGKVIDSIIIGILCMIGMTVLRMPYAPLISVIIGVTNVIPYFGPFIGAIPSFVIIFIVNPWQAVWFLIFILVLQQLDGNVIGPKILGDSIGLSPLWIVFSIMLFSGMLGFVGMFIGVPLFAVIYSLIRRFISYLLRRKGESTNTRDYASDNNPLIK